MFDPKNIKIDSKRIFDSILKVLKDVRERGFATEDLFQEKLDKYNIPYKRYARDYGFVDRFLGVDFVVQKGNEWLPVQVKSSKNEPQYRIEELDCDEPVIAIKDGNDFRLNNSRGFERYFCDFLKVCRKKD
jgi:predicted AAA+ superfamily ATPase